MTDRALRPRAGSSAKAQLLTVLGEFVLAGPGSVWTATMIEAGAALGVNERSVRQALTRLADDGVVCSERHGRRTRWQLTATGRSMLEAGAERIYGLGAANDSWDGRWLVVMVSVPEEHRAKRHQLRSRLAFAGLGSISAGVAVTPHVEREKQVNQVLADLDLDGDATVFLAEAGSFSPDAAVMERAWDLEGLAEEYREFARVFASLEAGDRVADDGEEAFVALVQLVHAWRRFPFVDPEIPAVLLPSDWPGHEAAAVFAARRDSWKQPAGEWFANREQVNT